MPQTAYGIDTQPSVVRYPRGTGYGLEKLQSLFGYDINEMPTKGAELEIGKGRIVRRPRATARQKAVILSLGTRLAPSLEAAIQLEVGLRVIVRLWLWIGCGLEGNCALCGCGLVADVYLGQRFRSRVSFHLHVGVLGINLRCLRRARDPTLSV